MRWLFQWAPTYMQPALLRDHPSLEQIVQVKLDILTEKGDLAQARQLARSYAIVKPGENYCGEAQAKSRAGAERDETFKAFRLATLGQPEAADCIWWYGQWLSDEGYVRLGRLMVIEGTRVTPSATNKESGARYLKIRLGGNREVPKRAEQLFLIARQRYLAMATSTAPRSSSTNRFGWRRRSRGPTTIARRSPRISATARPRSRGSSAPSKPIPTRGAPIGISASCSRISSAIPRPRCT